MTPTPDVTTAASPRRRICICTSRERALRQPFHACIATVHDGERARR